MSKREASFRRKYGDEAGSIIFRLLNLNMTNNRWRRRRSK